MLKENYSSLDWNVQRTEAWGGRISNNTHTHTPVTQFPAFDKYIAHEALQ
jgi:hypothetical protein